MLLHIWLTTSALGMGNKYAWHGTIDTRARGSVVISKGEEEEELENQKMKVVRVNRVMALLPNVEVTLHTSTTLK